MQLPKRRRTNEPRQDEIVYLTPGGLQALEAEIRRLDGRDRPRAVRDVSEAVQKGDLSENAEYQEARARLSRIEHRLLVLREKRKRAEVITAPKRGAGRKTIEIGSSVTLEREDGTGRKTYEIVGPEETDPSRGRISFRSPVGAALLGKKKGDAVLLGAEDRAVAHRVIAVA